MRLYYHFCGYSDPHHFYGIAMVGTALGVAFFLVLHRVIMRAVVEASPHNAIAGLALRGRRDHEL